MELTRSGIKKFLIDEFINTDYYKKVRNSNLPDLVVLKDMNIKDLTFMSGLYVLLKEIKTNYAKLISDSMWDLSLRQRGILNNLVFSLDSLKFDEIGKKKAYNVYLHNFDDFYWQVWDYFDDYGNQNEIIYKEEIDKIVPHIEDFFSIYENEIKKYR